MKLDKKQLPQLIVLGVLLIGCVCFVSFQLKSVSKPAPKKPPVAQVKAGEEAASEAGEQVAKAVFPSLDSTVARRDPFQPAKLPVDPTDVMPDDYNQPRPSQRTSASVKSTGKLPVKPFNPFAALASAKVDVEPAEKPAAEVEKDPEFSLTGIVRGGENVAIIRVGDTGRYVVKQGQFVEGRYQVLSVTSDSATLQCNGRRIHIKLGGV